MKTTEAGRILQASTASLRTVQCRFCGKLTTYVKPTAWTVCPACRISTRVPE